MNIYILQQARLNEQKWKKDQENIDIFLKPLQILRYNMLPTFFFTPFTLYGYFSIS